MRFLW